MNGKWAVGSRQFAAFGRSRSTAGLAIRSKLLVHGSYMKVIMSKAVHYTVTECRVCEKSVIWALIHCDRASLCKNDISHP